jgi:hypothetical protein
VEAWLGETRRRVGVSREDWLHPAVEALAEALDGGSPDPGPALARLGRARAAAGFTLDEVIEDLRCLYDVVDPARRAPLDRFDTLEVARGWADGFVEATQDIGCVDPLTGLATEAFLRARLAQTYRHCDALGLAAGDGHTLVVVRLALDGVREPDRSLLAVRAAERLRTVFTGGETLSTIGPGRFIALVANTPELGAALAALADPLLPTTRPGHPSATRTRTYRVWVEPLPATVNHAIALLDDLARPAD